MIVGIPSSQYEAHRAQILPFLEGFSARCADGKPVSEFEAEILARDAQVWSIKGFQALALTKVTPNAVRITHCAGKRPGEWSAQLDRVLTAWTASLGKSYLISLARPGWAKTARPLGYRETHREFTKKVPQHG